MPRVYVSNHNEQHDYSKALRFGTIMPVTTGPINVFRPQRSLVAMCENLKTFTEEDYILFSGNALSGLLILEAVHNKVRHLNLLVFNAREDDYIHHRLDLDAVRFIPIDD
jgi:hypothetical protein